MSEETKTDSYFKNCLFFTANSLARNITKMAEDAFATSSLTPNSAFLVMIINEKGKLTSTEVSVALDLAPSTITRFAQALEKRGLLKKENEGKFTYLLSTKKGLALQKELENCWKKLFEEYCNVLGRDFAIKLTENTYIASKKLENL